MPNGQNEFFALRENVLRGAVSSVNYYSKTTKSLGRMQVCTPPGYQHVLAEYLTVAAFNIDKMEHER